MWNFALYLIASSLFHAILQFEITLKCGSCLSLKDLKLYPFRCQAQISQASSLFPWSQMGLLNKTGPRIDTYGTLLEIAGQFDRETLITTELLIF